MAEYFKIDLPDKHKNIIQQIKIDKSYDPFSNFHYSSKSFNGSAYKYIYQSILKVSSKNSVELAKEAAKIINKILELAIEKLSKNMNIKNYNKLIWLRYCTETKIFDEPRWHIDGNYYLDNMTANKLKNQKKIIISLIGPGTLILNCDKKTNNELYIKLIEVKKKYPRYDKNNKLNIENVKKVNDKINKKLKSCQMKQLENFDGVIYKIGCPSIIDSCIHSEPKFDKPRLFLGLVLNEI
jgi:hypothetical protein